MPVCATVSVAVPVRPPSRAPPGEPTPLQSRCAGLSRGNFRVGGGFVCTGRCLGGGDGREGYFSPLFLFIGSLTTARTAAAPPLFHVCRASRHYLPPPRGVIRCQSGLGRRGSRIKGWAAALEGVGWGSRLCYPGVGAPTLDSVQAHRVRLGRPHPPHDGIQKTA